LGKKYFGLESPHFCSSLSNASFKKLGYTFFASVFLNFIRDPRNKFINNDSAGVERERQREGKFGKAAIWRDF
jgi:hypothetical protein